MAKFPTEVTESVVVPVPLRDAYRFFWDVPTSARCIPGLDRCEDGGSDVYRFVFEERSTGPVSMCVTYTAKYTGNGTDEIRCASTGAEGDNTDVDGVVRLEPVDDGHTRVTVQQMLAPDTPVDLAWRLGLSLRWLAQDHNGGCADMNMLGHALRGIESGAASAIVVLASEPGGLTRFRFS